jgi:hypothetical protein
VSFKWVAGVIAVGLSALGLAGVALGKFDPRPPAAAGAAGQPRTAGLNTPARDGMLEFTVTAISCGRETLSSTDVIRRAQGEYCLAWLQVRNLGAEARTFAAGSQTAIDARNVAYSNDDSAEFPVNATTQAFLEPIDPSATAKGTLVFDVPTGTKLSTLELHDSYLSPGVKINITSR